MENNILDKHGAVLENLFGLWEEVGSKADLLRNEHGLRFIRQEGLWPDLMFGLHEGFSNWKALREGARSGRYPRAMALGENALLEDQLQTVGYQKTSTVRSMCWDAKWMPGPKTHVAPIERVDDMAKLTDFSHIASVSFGYEILPKMFRPFLEDTEKIRMYIQEHRGKAANCGLLFLDDKDGAGIHIIGTLPEHRGMGLGRSMTEYQLKEAIGLGPSHIGLVASEGGARIYSKMGFEPVGHMVTYRFGGSSAQR
ncbi:GNAT family N-acetyltransferase [Muricauda sp. NFXS6]|uniref:GNAT family N-acetyltransferase n=1 Tax=Allomuricauda sp. NFXS6 TaxID=2819094 RepID=UPI0032DF0D60